MRRLRQSNNRFPAAAVQSACRTDDRAAFRQTAACPPAINLKPGYDDSSSTNPLPLLPRYRYETVLDTRCLEIILYRHSKCRYTVTAVSQLRGGGSSVIDGSSFLREIARVFISCPRLVPKSRWLHLCQTIPSTRFLGTFVQKIYPLSQTQNTEKFLSVRNHL